MGATADMPDNPPSTQPASRARAGGSLLATKLYAPSPRADLVERPRLLRLLEEGRTARLILLSAPAGSGKTTLLAGQEPGAGPVHFGTLAPWALGCLRNGLVLRISRTRYARPLDSSYSAQPSMAASDARRSAGTAR